jgi:hypothetical protein
MALLSKTFLFLKSLLTLSFFAVSNQPSYFLYLNNPETLTKTGIVHEKKIQKNTKIRYFLHFKNGTKSNQTFSFNTQKPVENLKKSFNSHELPERAGALTSKNFMLSKEKTSKISFSSSLSPETTISGIVEGIFKKDDIVRVQFGNTKNKIETFDFYQSSYSFQKDISLDLNSVVSYRLGEREEAMVPGGYGSNINLNVTPKQTGILKLSCSPRGGAGILVFSHRGIIYMTKLIPARENYNVMYLSVEKNKTETFTFIPCGGLNYPIRLDFSLSSVLVDEKIA